MDESLKNCIEECNNLLRGELAAMQTYNQAIEKTKDTETTKVLSRIREDHVRSISDLQQNIIDMGGDPVNDSGFWGSVAQGVEGTAALLGETPAIAVLKQGEEYGKRSYEDALDNEDILPECKQMIRNQLLPRQELHLAALSNL